MVNGISDAVSQAPWNPPSAKEGGGFVQALQSAVSSVDGQQQDAQQKVANLLAGNGEDVHSAMIAVERAELSFQLVMQLRNKAVAAYEEVARMQF